MYCRCNLCGRLADWLVLFYDSVEDKKYATTRCDECRDKPEPQLDNKVPYNNIPLWHGSWAFPEYRVDSLDSPIRLTYAEVRARLSPDVIFLPNQFQKDKINKRVYPKDGIILVYEEQEDD